MDKRRASVSAVVATLVTSILDSSSSSSSSDSEEELILNELLNFKQNPAKKGRLGDCITKPLLECSDEEFFEDFRMRRSVVAAFIARYARSSFYIPHSVHGGLPQKSPEEHILCFLWYATNKVCIRDVAIRFCISESTVYGIIERLLDYLCSLLPRKIRFPEGLDLLADDFEQLSGFPGVVGCIGGTCINTRSPVHVLKSSNQQSLSSVRLQAVCDSKCRFMDVFVGAPGDLESESVFLASPLAEELPYWCHDKYHLLGDRGYPLREYLLTPYDDQGSKDLTEHYEVAFNERHEKTRAKIDDAFRLLRQRFRQLHFLEFVTASKMRRFIMACCVVHNMCVEAGDVELEFEWTETDADYMMTVCSESDAEAEEKDERELGSLKRERLAQNFVT